MSINKDEYLSAERKIRACNEIIFVQKDEADATRLIISDTEPEENNVAWIKPITPEASAPDPDIEDNNLYFVTKTEGVPVGCIVPYLDNTTIPNGFLVCDGSEILISEYPALYEVIGDNYGTASDAEHFVLPDLDFISSAPTNGIYIIRANVIVDTYLTSSSSLQGTTATTTKDGLLSSADKKLLNEVNENYRQNSKAYTVGAFAFSSNLPAGLVLKCTTAGMTSATEPDFSGATVGGTVTDGAAVWTYVPLGTLSREITPAFNHRDVITTSGVYTAPVTGWYRVTVKGGGGGGAAFLHSSQGGDNYGGGGGGEGGTAIAFEFMTAGATASVVIGGGGSGGTYSTHTEGYAGGNSSVAVNSNTYTGGGGEGGNVSGVSGGGAGGVGTISGNGGGSGHYSLLYSSSGGTAIGGTGGGNGGGTSHYQSNGTNAETNSGAGGGGGSGTYGAANFNGGNGADGFAWFEYFAPSL